MLAPNGRYYLRLPKILRLNTSQMEQRSAASTRAKKKLSKQTEAKELLENKLNRDITDSRKCMLGLDVFLVHEIRRMTRTDTALKLNCGKSRITADWAENSEKQNSFIHWTVN